MRFILKLSSLLFVAMFFLISCQDDFSEAEEEEKETLTTGAREFFEATISQAVTKGTLNQSRNWSPGEVTPHWDEVGFKQDENYEYVFVPIFTQKYYIGRQYVHRKSGDKYYHVRVSQLLCIRRDKEGTYSGAYITLIPSKGYYTANQNNVIQQFMKGENFNSNFTGRIAYNNFVTGRILAVDKVNDGVFEWGFSKQSNPDNKSFGESYIKMFKHISLHEVAPIRTRADLEEFVVENCEKCKGTLDYYGKCKSCDSGLEEDPDYYQCAACGNYVPYEYIASHACNDDSGGDDSSSGGDDSSSGGNNPSGGHNPWGGGNTGGGSNNGNTNNGNSNLNKIVGTNALSTIDKNKLEQKIKEMLEDCGYQALFNYAERNGFKINNVRINAIYHNSGYLPQTNEIVFNSSSAIDNNSFDEEFIHFIQNNMYPGGISQYADKGKINIEFEAKMIQDIICGSTSPHINGCNYLGAHGETSEQYKIWVDEVSEVGTFPNYNQIKTEYWRYMEGLKTVPQYNTEIDKNLQPLVLNFLNKNACK